jgi:hypothetical protein
MMDANAIASELTPLEADALIRCCERGSTRTNDSGLVDTLLSGLCGKVSEGITNGWLVEWSMNPGFREDAYSNLYKPTGLGKAVGAILLVNRGDVE